MPRFEAPIDNAGAGAAKPQNDFLKPVRREKAETMMQMPDGSWKPVNEMPKKQGTLKPSLPKEDPGERIMNPDGTYRK